MQPASVDPWSVAITAGSGLGILAATACHLLHVVPLSSEMEAQRQLIG